MRRIDNIKKKLLAVLPLINFVKFENGKCWLDWENNAQNTTGCEPLSNEPEWENITAVASNQTVERVGWGMFFESSGDISTEI